MSARSGGTPRVDAAERTYRRALLAYPRRYRRIYGAEILSTLQDAADAREREPAESSGPGSGEILPGPPQVARRREVVGLLLGGLRVRARRWWPALLVAGMLQTAFTAGGGLDMARVSIGNDLGDAASRAGVALHSWSTIGGAVLDLYGAPLLAAVLLVALARRWTRVAVAVLAAQAALVVAAGVVQGIGYVPWRLVGLAWMALPVLALALRGRSVPHLPAWWIVPIVAGYWWAHTAVVGAVSVSIVVIVATVLVTPVTARAGALVAASIALENLLVGGAGTVSQLTAVLAVALVAWAALLELVSDRAGARRRRPA
ncbi:MAG: hypothetical protein U0Q15_05765 [Kineosporiaceae bacterium]